MDWKHSAWWETDCSICLFKILMASLLLPWGGWPSLGRLPTAMLLSSICRNASKAISLDPFQQSADWTAWAAQRQRALPYKTTKHITFPSLFPITCYCSLQLWLLSSCLLLWALRLQPDRTERGCEVVKKTTFTSGSYILKHFQILRLRFSQSFLKYVSMNYITVPPCAPWCLTAASCIVFCLLGYSSIWWLTEEITLCL